MTFDYWYKDAFDNTCLDCPLMLLDIDSKGCYANDPYCVLHMTEAPVYECDRLYEQYLIDNDGEEE